MWFMLKLFNYEVLDLILEFLKVKRVSLNCSQVAEFIHLTPSYASLTWPWIQVALDEQSCHKNQGEDHYIEQCVWFMMPHFILFICRTPMC